MNRMIFVTLMGINLVGAPSAFSQAANMSFFITSEGSGDGGNLGGGLAGADRHCQTLASNVRRGNRTWRSYLSLTHQALTINARDRIGDGPWYNYDGDMVAADVEDLHSDNANITNESALTEQGGMVNVEGQRNRHDILTGSRPNGTAWPYAMMDLLNFESHNLTCSNWTSNAEDGSAIVGHHDRGGSVGYSSWNAVHPTNGCS